MQHATHDAKSDGATLTHTLKRAISVREFCNQYSMGRTTAYSMIARGALRSVLIGGRRLIPVDAAEALLQGEKK
jgi:excisionase family DNA binding protein